MKRFFCLTFALLLCRASSLIAETADDPTPNKPKSFEKGQDIFPRWSVVGTWQVTAPDWSDIVSLNNDGTMARARASHETGHWTLSADGGTPMLVLRWDNYGTESLTMVTLDHFRGQTKPHVFIEMRREKKAK